MPPRVDDVAKAMADGGKEVVGALDQRIGDVAGVINARGAELAESIGAKIDDIDKALGVKAHGGGRQSGYAGSAASRSCCADAPETPDQEIETRSQAARGLAQPDAPRA